MTPVICNKKTGRDICSVNNPTSLQKSKPMKISEAPSKSGHRCTVAVPFSLTVAALLILGHGDAPAQDGEALFKQNCTACHTIGGGKLVGPDLQGVTLKRKEGWLLQFVKNSQEFINSGDSEAKALFAEFNSLIMPPQNVSDVEIKAILTFIAGKNATAVADSAVKDSSTASVPVADVTVPKASDATEEDIQKGAELYQGKLAFANGAVACISCHHVNNEKVLPGGNLAKDLTGVHSRLGDAGITGILNAPPFPAMTQSYKDRVLNAEEIRLLNAFLAYAAKEEVNQPQANKGDGILLYGGIAGLVVFLGLIFGIWSNRKKKSVNDAIYKRQVKSI